MPELEKQLVALGESIAWPEGPSHLWGRVGPRLTEVPRVWQPRWLLAAAAVLVVVATLVAYTPTRDAIAGWLSVHTVIHRVQNQPTPAPGAALDLGTRATLDQARHQVGWDIVVPSSLGVPDAVYVKLPPSGPSGGEVTLVYVSRPGIRQTGSTGVSILVTEARGQVNEPFFYKVVGPDATVEQVSVNGHPGFWISGRPHEFAFADSQGNPIFETLRLATNTLTFDDAGTVVRIEGDMTEAQAFEIARSMT